MSPPGRGGKHGGDDTVAEMGATTDDVSSRSQTNGT
jgi:hypothetical protein